MPTGSVNWAALASYPADCGAGTAETITGAWTFSLAETEDLAIDISISGTNSGQGGKSGPIIGKALESFTCQESSVTCQGKVMVFVSTGWFVAPLEQDVSSQMSDLSEINTETLMASTISTDVLFIGDRKLDMAPDGSLVIDGSVNILGDLKVEGELTTEKLNVSDEATGSSVLVAGQTKIEIKTSLITDKSQVLITLHCNISYYLFWIRFG